MSKNVNCLEQHLAHSVQFSSVAQLCLTLWDPMNRSTPGLPVHHQLPEFTQIHVHWVGDDIQPSHPLSSPSPPAYYLSQHQGLSLMCLLLTSGGPNIGASVSASVFPMNSQGWFPLGFTGLISLLSKRLSRVFSSTIVWNINPLALNSHIHTWLLEKS